MTPTVPERLRRLVALSAPGSNSDAVRNAANAMREEDWAPALDFAAFHGVTPLLRRNLLASGMERSLPPDAAIALRAETFKTAVVNMTFLKEAKSISTALEARGVKHVFLKGPALIGPVYEPSLRPMRDLDLAVRECDRESAGRVLENLGFALDPGQHPVAFQIRYGGELKYRKTGQGLPGPVELQWEAAHTKALRRCTRLPLGEWIPPLEAARPGPDALPSLPPDEHFVFCAFHAAMAHAFVRLIWLYDLAQLGKIADLERAAYLAREARMERAFRTTLDLLSVLLDWTVPMPAGASAAARPWRRKTLELAMNNLAGRATPLEEAMLPMLLCRRPSRYAAVYLTPDPAYHRERSGGERKGLLRRVLEKTGRLTRAAVRKPPRSDRPSRRSGLK